MTDKIQIHCMEPFYVRLLQLCSIGATSTAKKPSLLHSLQRLLFVCHVLSAIKNLIVSTYYSNKALHLDNTVFAIIFRRYNRISEFYPPANEANERSKICVVSRGGNFFITVKKSHPPVYGSDSFVC
jgi:hypothetical protein